MFARFSARSNIASKRRLRFRRMHRAFWLQKGLLLLFISSLPSSGQRSILRRKSHRCWGFDLPRKVFWSLSGIFDQTLTYCFYALNLRFKISGLGCGVRPSWRKFWLCWFECRKLFVFSANCVKPYAKWFSEFDRKSEIYQVVLQQWSVFHVSQRNVSRIRAQGRKLLQTKASERIMPQRKPLVNFVHF